MLCALDSVPAVLAHLSCLRGCCLCLGCLQLALEVGAARRLHCQGSLRGGLVPLQALPTRNTVRGCTMSYALCDACVLI